ncbi:MAG TPA: sialidase family protein, partial [Acidobacteriaceae bacterium]|nr:sialidase family protein [Acidobacteriaceae bacterium]
MKYLLSALVAAICMTASAARIDRPAVSLIHVPNGGIQPQVIEQDGVVHLIYFSGPAEKGDIYYVQSRDFGQTFSQPLRVNHRSGSAIAVGNIRGAQLAVGRGGRVYVAWNGSAAAEPRGPAGETPMLYTRLNDRGTAFEPERNLIHEAYGLDGGGSVAADAKGDVYVFWHAPLVGQKGEGSRRVWMAKSVDDGRTFAREKVAFDAPTGACGCCGMRAYADSAGNLYVLFRSATDVVNR